ncbi:MAG: redox-sensing transcriptional repressor Rex [Lachnospiraceae bacterium]|nr:redox-sensing transcriptional repressor Rex [Lachnospiraceae bacterium]
MDKEISKAVIRRMPRYYRYLGDLIDKGVERISSYDLSVLMHVTASQIRQDLNNFGGFGQQGYGYNVKYLYEEIGKILGLNVVHNIIIIGAGNVGQAIANYINFERIGFNIIALFDVNPDLIGKSIRGIKIYDYNELEDFVKNNKVDIAALTLPKEAAVKSSLQLIDLGVKAFWNFANVDIDHEDKTLIVENVHLSESLMRLSYNIVRQDKA